MLRPEYVSSAAQHFWKLLIKKQHYFAPAQWAARAPTTEVFEDQYSNENNFHIIVSLFQSIWNVLQG